MEKLRCRDRANGEDHHASQVDEDREVAAQLEGRFETGGRFNGHKYPAAHAARLATHFVNFFTNRLKNKPRQIVEASL
jgi:hypothetical protein